MSYKSTLYVPFEFVLVNKISTKNRSNLILTHFYLKVNSSLNSARKCEYIARAAYVEIAAELSRHGWHETQWRRSLTMNKSNNLLIQPPFFTPSSGNADCLEFEKKNFQDIRCASALAQNDFRVVQQPRVYFRH